MILKELIKFGMEESQEPVIKNPILRQALEPRTMDQASLADDLEPGSLKDEMLKDFDPSQETYEEYLQRKSLGERPFNMAEGGQLVKPSVDGSRPGYKGKMKWTTKEVQEIYANLPEGMSVSKRVLPSGRTDYTYRAKVRGDNVGKPTWRAKSMVATPENKKKMIELVEAKYDEYYPNRLSRKEYAEIRLKPENRRLRGEDFAKKLNDAGYTTYTGDEWGRANVYDYDRTKRGGKSIAKDLGFFEKRTVQEAKDIIKQFSGGKDFLKNKNLTDANITTKAAEYVAQEKFHSKEGGKSWPRGRQNKRKIWSNIYESHKQGGRFELVNGKDLADADGTINWKKGSTYSQKNPFETSNANWRKAKFRDKKSGAIFTYDNLEKMVDKHGGGYEKAIKAYDDNAKLNRMTFKGKTLNDWFREDMIKKDYEVLVGKKVRMDDPGFLKYMGKKKPFYSFTEAHHFKGIKDHPFDTEPALRLANRKQGNIQNSYDKAMKSGNPNRMAKAKTKYIEDMNKLSDEMGGIRFKMDDIRFVGEKGTPQTMIKGAVEASGISKKNKINILNAFCGSKRKKFATAGTVDGLTCSMEEIQENIKKQTNQAMKATKDGKIPKKFGKLKALGKFFGWIDAPIEFYFAAPHLIAGDVEGAKRATTAGLAGWGKVDLDNISDEKAQRYIKHTKAMNDYFDNYASAVDAENQLENMEPGSEDYSLISSQFERAKTNMDKIQEDYQSYGYTYQDGDIPMKDKVATQNYIRDKVKSDFENKIENIASNETFKDADPDLLKEQLRDLGGRPEKVTPITDLESYMKNKGEEMAGNTNWFFNQKPYVLEEAEALGVGDIFDDYALGAGVEAEGRKSLQDAYSEIPLEYANELAALEKKQLEEGLKKKRIQKLLENQYFSQGGIAGIRRPNAIPPESGPTPQGLPSMLNRVKRI